MVDFLTLSRPQRPVLTKELVDDERPDVKITVSLRYLNAVEQLKAAEKAEEMIARYITGTKDEPVAPYVMIGGEPPELTESLIRSACSLEVMQAAEPRLSVDNIIAMAHTSPSIYLDFTAFARKVNMGYDPKAEVGGDTAPLSASA